MSGPIVGGLAALASALGGFFALGLAMDRHYEDSFGRGSSPGRKARWLQAGGALGLVLSLVVCSGLRGAAQGAVLWCGVMTASAIVVALMLSYAPRHSARVLAATSTVAVMALAMRWLS